MFLFVFFVGALRVLGASFTDSLLSGILVVNIWILHNISIVKIILRSRLTEPREYKDDIEEEI